MTYPFNSERKDITMYAVTIYINIGKGNQIHPRSGTYSLIALRKVMLDMLVLDNLVNIDIQRTD